MPRDERMNLLMGQVAMIGPKPYSQPEGIYPPSGKLWCPSRGNATKKRL